MRSKIQHKRAWGFGLLLLLILTWEFFSLIGLIDAILLPGPADILLNLPDLFKDRQLYADISITLFRFIAGYAIGCAIAIPLGLFMGLNKRAYASLDVLVEGLRPIPASALVPAAMLFFGLGNQMAIVVVAYAVIWPVLVNTMDGVRSVEPLLVDTGRIFGLKFHELVLKIFIPASLPSVATGMRISLALSITLVIVVEMIVGNEGLGHRIIDAERTFRFSEMYAFVLIVGGIGYLSNRIFLVLSKFFNEWHYGYHRADE